MQAVLVNLPVPLREVASSSFSSPLSSWREERDRCCLCWGASKCMRCTGGTVRRRWVGIPAVAATVAVVVPAPVAVAVVESWGLVILAQVHP